MVLLVEVKGHWITDGQTVKTTKLLSNMVSESGQGYEGSHTLHADTLY